MMPGKVDKSQEKFNHFNQYFGISTAPINGVSRKELNIKKFGLSIPLVSIVFLCIAKMYEQENVKITKSLVARVVLSHLPPILLIPDIIASCSTQRIHAHNVKKEI